MRNLTITISLAVALAAFSPDHAQAQQATLEQQLESQYMPTTLTADNRDIVTMGSVLIFQKRGFSAGAVTNQVPSQNTYKDGQIKANVTGTLQKGCRIYNFPGCDRVQSAVGPLREFVTGETIYVTRIAVDRNKDAIVFYLISDMYGNSGRFRGSLAFQFPRGSLEYADWGKIQSTIAEVFRAAPADDSSAAVPQRQPMPPVQTPLPVTQAQPEPALPAIVPPPPPPPDPPAPVSIEAGQTREQVVGILGEPDKIVKGPGAKEIYQYRDIKITFINGKLTDAQ